MWNFMIEGGWLMLPIGLCSLFSLAIIIERTLFYFFNVGKFNTPFILSQILECVRKNKISEAVDICKRSPYYVTSILQAGLLRNGESKEIIKEAMEDASLYQIPNLEKNLNFLSTVAHISPLLGLLGTVVGLVECFRVIEQRTVSSGLINPQDLSRGIRVALHTTVFGLFVAIPSYLAYNYFVHKVNMYTLEAEKAAAELLEIISGGEF